MPPRPAPPIPATAAGKTCVFLVDGYALIYRAFFAMIARPLTTKSGENTSAVWGITNFLVRLSENYHPEYVGWLHDRGVSFRSAQYPEYKATREKLSAELQQDFDRSLERVCQILDAFHIPVIAINGYEADDVVATLAQHAVADGLQAVIISGDKDFYQLIGAGIALLNPGRGGQAAVEEQWVDQSNASERLGVPPERVVDYLALVGDSSDNIPGVKGIGDKTAIQLLETYGDLDAILARAADIPGKRPREALLQQADNARLSRELVTLRRDVPVELDLDQLRVRTPDADTLAQLFTELAFRTLIPKLDDLASVRLTPAAEPPSARSLPIPPSARRGTTSRRRGSRLRAPGSHSTASLTTRCWRASFSIRGVARTPSTTWRANISLSSCPQRRSCWEKGRVGGPNEPLPRSRPRKQRASLPRRPKWSCGSRKPSIPISWPTTSCRCSTKSRSPSSPCWSTWKPPGSSSIASCSVKCRAASTRS